MRRHSLWCLVGYFLIASSAYATETFPPPLVYQSSQTTLTYRYNTDTGQPSGRTTSFSAQTSYGELRGVATYNSPTLESAASVTFTLVSNSQQLIVTYAPSSQPSQPNVGTVLLDWSGFGALSITFNVSTYDVINTSGTVTNCEGLADSNLHKALLELQDRVRTDLDLQSAPGVSHEQFIAGWLEGTIILSRVADLCRASLHFGGCGYTQEDWGDCQQCCKDFNSSAVRGVVTALCGGYNKLCKGPQPWCVAGLLVCGATQWAIDADDCIAHECEGKPGDPSCLAPLACEYTCQGVCLPGQNSECGYCATPEQPACCKND